MGLTPLFIDVLPLKKASWKLDEIEKKEPKKGAKSAKKAEFHSYFLFLYHPIWAKNSRF